VRTTDATRPVSVPATTRDKLLLTALHLFARQGLDVTLRDINEHAGQRNASALHYHFGGRYGLLEAILDRYRLSDDEYALIREEIAAGPRDVRAVVAGLVGRSCAWLSTADGRDYARFTFQFVMRLPLREHLSDGLDAPSLASVRAQAELLHELLPDLPERLVRERVVASLDLILLQVAERARIIDDEGATGLLDEDEFVENLVDMATGLLTAPASTSASTTR
jgi:AcrR family transcriptional regulator